MSLITCWTPGKLKHRVTRQIEVKRAPCVVRRAQVLDARTDVHPLDPSPAEAQVLVGIVVGLDHCGSILNDS